MRMNIYRFAQAQSRERVAGELAIALRKIERDVHTLAEEARRRAVIRSCSMIVPTKKRARDE